MKDATVLLLVAVQEWFMLYFKKIEILMIDTDSCDFVSRDKEREWERVIVRINQSHSQIK